MGWEVTRFLASFGLGVWALAPGKSGYAGYRNFFETVSAEGCSAEVVRRGDNAKPPELG